MIYTKSELENEMENGICKPERILEELHTLLEDLSAAVAEKDFDQVRDLLAEWNQ